MIPHPHLLEAVPEELALHLIAAAHPSAETDATLLALCLTPLDWSEVLHLGLWHKVGFLTYARLRDAGLLDQALKEGSLPLLVLNHWKQLHAVNAHRNRTLLARAAQIETCAADAAIPLVVSKGGRHLIPRCYRAEDRKMYDIDLLVDRTSAEDAIALLQGLGFSLGSYDHGAEEVLPLPSAQLRNWMLLGRGMPNFLRVEKDAFHPYSIAQVQFLIGSTELGKVVPADLFLTKGARRDPETGHLKLTDAAVFVQLCLHLYRETQESAFAAWSMDHNLIKYIDLGRFVVSLSESARCEALDFADEIGFKEECCAALGLLSAVFDNPAFTGMNATTPPVSTDLVETLSALGRMHGAPAPAWESIVGRKST